jgi:hypothetical protein
MTVSELLIPFKNVRNLSHIEEGFTADLNFDGSLGFGTFASPPSLAILQTGYHRTLPLLDKIHLSCH